MWSFSLELLKELLTAWRGGNRKIRATVIAAGLLVMAGAFIALFSDIVFAGRLALIARDIAAALAGFGALLALVIYGLQKSQEEVAPEEKIADVEKRAQENPKQTQVAWELARVKLESYLNRNLSQVRSIFFLTVVVMTAGFSLIAIGAYAAFRDPEHFKASVLSSISGIVVSFIGGTFLVLYKSTMAQAKDYVTILERINAVGMSVQILDTLDGDDKTLKHRTIAEVARQLLQMYAVQVPPAKSRSARVTQSSTRS